MGGGKWISKRKKRSRGMCHARKAMKASVLRNDLQATIVMTQKIVRRRTVGKTLRSMAPAF